MLGHTKIGKTLSPNVTLIYALYMCGNLNRNKEAVLT